MNEAPYAVPARRPVPLRRRPVDWVLIAFFAVNLCFATATALNEPADGENEPADGEPAEEA